MTTKLAAALASAMALAVAPGMAAAQPRAPQGPGYGASPAAPTSPEGVTAVPGQNTAGDQTLQEPSIPTSPPPRVGLFPEFGTKLLNAGVDFHGIAFDHFFANPTAGTVPGQTNNLAAIRPAADFDLQRMLGLPGGNIHVGLTFFGLRSDIPQIITQAGGTLTGFQTTPTTQTNVVSLLTYEQRFLDGRLSIEAGRTNVFNYFLLPNSLDPFSYFSPTFQVVGDFNSTPFPVWGGRATYRITPALYAQVGAFEDNYRYAVNAGDRFGTNRSTGVQVLGEIGYRTEFTTEAYPANFEVGFEWNTTRQGDRTNNAKGTAAPIIVPITAGAAYAGGGVFFAQGQKVVFRGPARPGGPPANIAVFGSISASVDKPQPIDMDALAGVNVTGFVPGRPFDAFGVQVRYQRLSNFEQARETLVQRILARQPGTQSRNGYAVELVGNVQLTPAVSLRPLVEYFIHPDNYYGPPASGKYQRPQSGFEAGFFLVASLGRLLGTSAKPF